MNLKLRHRWILFSAFCVLLLSILASSALTLGANPGLSSYSGSSQNDFSSAQSALAHAYSQISLIDQNGGNTTSLVSQLNIAVNLFQRAMEDESSDPVTASSELQNATEIANKVSNESVPILQIALAQEHERFALAITEAGVIITASVLLYLFGERIYNRLWLNQRKNFVVRSPNG
jgi:ABC-type uncharacterized transport system fused permease/ATPase subunit